MICNRCRENEACDFPWLIHLNIVMSTCIRRIASRETVKYDFS